MKERAGKFTWRASDVVIKKKGVKVSLRVLNALEEFHGGNSHNNKTHGNWSGARPPVKSATGKGAKVGVKGSKAKAVVKKVSKKSEPKESEAQTMARLIKEAKAKKTAAAAKAKKTAAAAKAKKTAAAAKAKDDVKSPSKKASSDAALSKKEVNALIKKHDNHIGAPLGFNVAPEPKGMVSGNFNADQVAAMATYRGNAFTKINANLRGNTKEVARVWISEFNETTDAVAKTATTGLDSAFKDAPLTTESFTVTRSMPPQLKGKTFTDKGFSSTTIDSEPSVGAGQDIVVMINVPSGSRALKLSDNSLENEVLLDRGGTYTYTGVFDNGRPMYDYSQR